MLPTIGSKELVAWLPTLLGAGAGHTVLIPELAYPTYEVGVRLAGATAVRTDATTAVGPGRVALIWVNSPSNPTGRVLPVEHLAKVVAFARERGAIVASDECYLSLSDGAPSILLAGGLRRVVRRPARGALDVEDVQHGRLPRRVRHR